MNEKKKVIQNSRKYLILVVVGLVFIMTVCIILIKFFLPAGSVPSDSLTKITDSNTTEMSESELTVSEQPMTEESMMPENVAIQIDVSQIHVNELDSLMPENTWDMARVYPDPESCVEVVWEEADIIAYYGTNLVPPYIPAGLEADEGNSTHPAVVSKENEVWEDTAILSFYDKESYTDNIPYSRGFNMEVSKLGILHDTFLDRTGWELSYINDVEISIGHYLQSYGPHDSPDGFYDFYVANFQHHDIEYELNFSGIDFEEIVKVIASIIYENNQFIKN